MKTLHLSRNRFALVDDRDFEWLNQWKWCFNTSGYAVRVPRVNGEKRPTIYMHAEILRAPKGMHVDHINRDKLDNRRSNLRIVTPSQNQFNRRIQSNNTSGYKGIEWFARTGKWKVCIGVMRKLIHLGYFSDINDAIEARAKAEIRYFGTVLSSTDRYKEAITISRNTNE